MDFLAYKISTIVQDTSSHNGFPRTSQKNNMDANFANLPGYKQTNIVVVQISTKWLPTSGLYQTMLVPEWAPYSCKIQSAQVLPIYLMELDSTWAPCLTPAHENSQNHVPGTKLTGKVRFDFLTVWDWEAPKTWRSGSAVHKRLLTAV